jgi:enediyne biosynthesis protein E4
MSRYLAVCAAAALFALLAAEAYFLGQSSSRALVHWSLAVREITQRIGSLHGAPRDDFMFRDVSRRSGITFVQYSAFPDRSSWYDHGNGLCAADVDGDGFVDLYFPNQIGRNELWVNKGDGTFENATDRSGASLAEKTSVSCSFADIDNDGDPDLYVTSIRSRGNTLLLNDGNGIFTDVSTVSGTDYDGHSSAGVFFDYDNDGLLDLLVVNFGDFTTNERDGSGAYVPRTDAAMLGADADSAEPTLLFKNLGNARFLDVTGQSGLIARAWSGDAATSDIDGNGYQDVFILNMKGHARFYLNDRGTFRDASDEYFPRTSHGGMGLAFFDFNNDSSADLFVSDMHTDMLYEQTYAEERHKVDPNRVRLAYAGEPDESTHVFGNSFYVRTDGGFVERSDEVGAETYWPWGISVADVNADGFQDAFVSAGMGRFFRYGVNSLLLNNAGKNFAHREFVLGIEPRAEPYFAGSEKECESASYAVFEASCAPGTARFSYASVIFDIENDGDLDVIATQSLDVPQVFVSDLGDKSGVRYLVLELEGTRSNRDGLGSSVTVFAGGTSYTQFANGKSGYLSQSSLPLYFGIGSAASVDRIEVRWPSGIRQEITGPIAANQVIRAVEP